jgi:hypothetical protein
MIRAFDLIVAMAGSNTRVVLGHGLVTNRDHLFAYRSKLYVLRSRVASAIARGWSLKVLKDSSPAAGYDDLLGGARIGPQLVRLLFIERQRELAKK